MCECELIARLKALAEEYRAEQARYELEYELFGGESKRQLASDREKRISAVEAKLKGMKPCAGDCAYKQARRQEELAKKARGENWRRVMETVADVAVLKASDAEMAEALKTLVRQVGLIEDKYSIIETIKEGK